MKKGLLSLALSVALVGVSLFFGTTAHAQSLEVTSIGGIETGGTITTWTHEGYNPLFVGTASPSSAITIDIDSVVVSTASAADGSWLFKPTTLSTVGSYEVAVSQGSDSILFTLAIAQACSKSSTTTSTSSSTVTMPDELLQTGSDDLLLLVAGGLFLIVAGAYAGAHLMGYFSEE